MLVRDVMTKDVHVVDPAAALVDAAREMRQLDVGSLPVCDGKRLVGMLTDRDIVVRAAADGRDPTKVAVREVMTPRVFYCFEDQDLTEAAQLMKQHQIRRLPVIDRDKRLTGILALGDVAIDGGDGRMTTEVVKEVSRPGRPAATHQPTADSRGSARAPRSDH